MLDWSQACEKVLANIGVLEVEEKPLLKCYGQLLAEDIYSDVDVPVTNTSALDGYAARAADIKNASGETPVILNVVETVIAGHLPRKSVEPGTAIRIMTGAVIPPGADCVIGFEDTDEADGQSGSVNKPPDKVSIYLSEKAGKNVRDIGENITRGSMVLPERTMVGPGEIAVLTSVGKAKVRLIRRPVVGILATGEELISLTTPLSPGKAYDSNTTAISTLVTHYGGIPKILGVARDNLNSILAKIKKGMGTDAIIVSGGVSKGDYDLVRDAIERMGKVIFSGVKITPGKPFSFGVIESNLTETTMRLIPVFALAGNPTACMVNFQLFVRPAILKMRGYTNISCPTVEAIMEESISGKKNIRSFMWVKLERRQCKYYATLTGSQKRGVLTSVALADGLAVVPEDTEISKGDNVEVMVLQWHGDVIL